MTSNIVPIFAACYLLLIINEMRFLQRVIDEFRDEPEWVWKTLKIPAVSVFRTRWQFYFRIVLFGYPKRIWVSEGAKRNLFLLRVHFLVIYTLFVGFVWVVFQVPGILLVTLFILSTRATPWPHLPERV